MHTTSTPSANSSSSTRHSKHSAKILGAKIWGAKTGAANIGALLLCLALGGCFAEDNDSVLNLGSVSVGQQLTDLKKARDTGAMSGQEYREAKANILLLLQNAALNQIDDDAEASIHIEVSSDDDDDSDRDDDTADNDRGKDKDDEGSSFLF